MRLDKFIMCFSMGLIVGYGVVLTLLLVVGNPNNSPIFGIEDIIFVFIIFVFSLFMSRK
jgi:hypothetical protein